MKPEIISRKPRKWKVQAFLIAWSLVATYFAVFEIDDRLRSYYTVSSFQGMTMTDIQDMIKDTPAGKSLEQ